MSLEKPGQSKVVWYIPQQKAPRTASLRTGFSAEVSSGHRKDIEDMVCTWIDANGSDNIPSHLANLANRARVDLNTIAATPRRRDKRDKSNPPTPTGMDGAKEGVLKGRRFVLTGVWPFQEGVG